MTEEQITSRQQLLDEAHRLQTRADEIATSFSILKANPLEFNQLMIHIGLLSQHIDTLLRQQSTELKSIADQFPNDD